MNYLEFKYPTNIIYLVLVFACLLGFIKGYAKKDRILKVLKLFDEPGQILNESESLKSSKYNFFGRFKSFIFLRFKTYKNIKLLLASFGLLLILFSLLGPQTFMDFQEIDKIGLDIYVLIDTSKSMQVEDIKPSRISRAKKTLEDLIGQLKGDRIGFIPYSSTAYVQMPLTDDYELARMFLNVIDTDLISGGGTDVGEAIRLAGNSFEQASGADRVIIILSDGEEHDSSALDVLGSLKDKHMKVFTVGIGTEKGGLIPVFGDAGKQKTDYKKDDKGQLVMSKLNLDMLDKIAKAGDGVCLQASTSGIEINQLLNNIMNLKRGNLKLEKVKRYRQQFQYFLGAGILLFVLVYLLPERRRTA